MDDAAPLTPQDHDEALLIAMLDNPHHAHKIAALGDDPDDEASDESTDLHDPAADFGADAK